LYTFEHQTIFMKKLYFLLFIPCILFSQTWQSVGADPLVSGNVGYFDMGFDSSNVLYVAYKSSSGGVSVLKYDGTNWVNVGGNISTATSIYFVSIAFDGDIPYVAYTDTSPGIYKARVKKFNGTAWEAVGDDPISTVNTTSVLKIFIHNSIPYLAFNGTSSNNLSTVAFNGTSWELMGSSNFSVGLSNWPVLRFLNDVPYISYVDNGLAAPFTLGGKITVKKFESGNWVYVGNPVISDGNAMGSSFEISNGVLYVSYQDTSVANKLSVKKFDGTNWVTVGALGFSEGAVNYTSLKVINDVPYVAFQDQFYGNKVSVMKWDGTSWVYVTTPGFSGTSSYFNNLQYNSNSLYVGFSHTANSNATVLKLDNYLGISDTKLENLVFYPNPTQQVLNMERKAAIGVKSISIYNLLGQMVITIPDAESISSIDVTNLKTGTYFIKVNTDKGTVNTKFVKE